MRKSAYKITHNGFQPSCPHGTRLTVYLVIYNPITFQPSCPHGTRQGDKDIRDIGQQELLDIQRFLHIVMPLFWFRDFPGVMA